MKYLCVLLLLFKFNACSGLCEYYAKGNNGSYENVVDDDCQEGPEDIHRPCAFDDLSCIRNFLAANSQCSPTFGSTPEPIRELIMKFYIPVANMTATDTDITIRGFEGANITEFYLSIPTGNVVLAVKVQNLNYTAEKSYWSYQRPAKEPIVLADFYTMEQDYVLFTVVIPKVPSLSLKYAEIYADFSNIPPREYIGPKIYTSNDPTVQAAIAAFSANKITAFKESYIFLSYYLMSIFIQSELCDFGVDTNNYLGFPANTIPGNAAF